MDTTFEEHKGHLRAVAYRMLGSVPEAEDAVQDTWLRYRQADTSDVQNLGGWLTTVVSRMCLNVLRARGVRQDHLADLHVPDPLVGPDPETEAVLADTVGLAMLVVLETLTPAERLAFVLHDIFGVPFDEVGAIAGRTPTSARQLASRARRRVRGAAPVADADLARQRAAVDAFFAAARGGDLEALVAVLDPDVVARSDGGPSRPAFSLVTRGAHEVAARAVAFVNPRAVLRPALVNGAAGVVVEVNGKPFAVVGFTVRNGRIVEIDALADPDRLRNLDL